MIDFSVSILPLVVLGLVNFVFSWIWYSPVLFAVPWMKALGKDPKHAMTEEDRKGMPVLFLNGIVSSFLLVYALMIFVHSLKVMDFGTGLLVGLVAWAGFALTHSANTLREGRKPLVLLINNGLFILTYAVYGGVLAVWR
jgi:hypothetical protein